MKIFYEKGMIDVMKRTIYLFAITVVTIICIVWGTSMHVGGRFGFFHFGEESDHYTDSIELEAFDAIEVVNADVMDLEIKQGTEYRLQYRCTTEDLEPEYQVAGGKLTIQQKKRKAFLSGINNCSVSVTIPSDSPLKTIDVNSDVGDVTLTGVTADICNGETNVGDFTAEDAEFEEMILNSDTGDVKVIDCFFSRLDVTSDVGDVKIESSRELADYYFDLETDVGEVEINGEDYGHKYKAEGGNGTLTVKSDVGDVKVKY